MQVTYVCLLPQNTLQPREHWIRWEKFKIPKVWLLSCSHLKDKHCKVWEENYTKTPWDADCRAWSQIQQQCLCGITDHVRNTPMLTAFSSFFIFFWGGAREESEKGSTILVLLFNSPQSTEQLPNPACVYCGDVTAALFPTAHKARPLWIRAIWKSRAQSHSSWAMDYPTEWCGEERKTTLLCFKETCGFGLNKLLGDKVMSGWVPRNTSLNKHK